MSLAPPADLTDDPLACALVEALARKPWIAVHWHALRDRLEEIGQPAAWAALEAECAALQWGLADWEKDRQFRTRTEMRIGLRQWRGRLRCVLKWEREPEIPF